jgi:RNA polymerase sigma-70 factor (ECF subfamily)
MELHAIPLRASAAKLEHKGAGDPLSAAAEQRTTAIAVARAKDGDREALRFLYVRYGEHVRGAVATIIRDHHECEDVTQLVFAKLMRAIVKFEDRGVPFVCWLRHLARNVALDHLRARRPIPVSELDDKTYDADADASADSLRSALATLPVPQREVIILRHLAGLSPSEIAARTGRTKSAVDGLHHRGRRALRAELSRLGAAPAISAAA